MEKDRCVGRRKGMGHGVRGCGQVGSGAEGEGDRGEAGWVVTSWYAL